MQILPKRLVSVEGLTDAVRGSYGPQYLSFVQAVVAKFNKFARVHYSYKIQFKTPMVIFGIILYLKSIKIREQNYDRMHFLQKLKAKHQQIVAATPSLEGAFIKFYDLACYALNDSNELRSVESEHQIHNYVYSLLNSIAGIKKIKDKEDQWEITYTPDQMTKISLFFEERIHLLDYDEQKQLLNKLDINSDDTYLMKAKKQYYLLYKSRQITLLSEGTITPAQLAAIFHLEANTSMPQNVSSPSSKQISRQILSSQLFPDEVQCTICAKKCSQFDALSWNYTHYCYECVIKPKVNTSAISQSVIQKYLKLKKFDGSIFTVICPQCKGETKISRYNPSNKPPAFTCKVCQKIICVEHEQYIGDCFCYCFTCKRTTLRIQSMLIQYCMSCRTRFCEICNIKSKKDCACLCMKCMNLNLIDHQCKERCHECLSVLPSMKICQCGKTICFGCYYSNFQRMEMSMGKQLICPNLKK